VGCGTGVAVTTTTTGVCVGAGVAVAAGVELAAAVGVASGLSGDEQATTSVMQRTSKKVRSTSTSESFRVYLMAIRLIRLKFGSEYAEGALAGSLRYSMKWRLWSKFVRRIKLGSMIAEVRDKSEELRLLCQRYGVESLELFGSAASGDFGPDSDLDFLVEFINPQLGDYADRFFGLLEGLEKMFGRSVDLVVYSAIKNPYFREEVDETKVRLYAA
jgi:predicted nucleotidyltransferase